MKLKPCPFCGGDAYVQEDDSRFFAACSNCFCNVGEGYDPCAMPDHCFYTKDAAVEAWNTRHGDEPQASWQPIETAPKDGTEIEIKGDAGPYGVTAWNGSAHWGTPVNWHRDSSTWLTGKDDAVLRLAGYIPTHWRPLGASPTVLKQTEGGA